jgi:Tfp pilus assembly protein PilF
LAWVGLTVSTGTTTPPLESGNALSSWTPGFDSAYNHVGAYLIKKRQLDQTKLRLEKATPAPRNANPGVSRFNLGRVGQIRHDFRRALRAYQKALELTPDYTLAKAAIQRFRARLN